MVDGARCCSSNRTIADAARCASAGANFRGARARTSWASSTSRRIHFRATASPTRREPSNGRRFSTSARATFSDIGAESTRPGHVPVDVPTEIARLIPVIRGVRERLPGAVISADTYKPEVFLAARAAGADMLNCVWGLPDDLLEAAAQARVPVVIMHNKERARYDGPVMDEVLAFLKRAAERALAAGIPRQHVIIDPGIGFGKTPDHNIEVLRRSRTSAQTRLSYAAGRFAQIDDREIDGPGKRCGARSRDVCDDGAGNRGGYRRRARARRGRGARRGKRRRCDRARLETRIVDVIALRGMRVYGKHGANPGEREREQPFDLEILAYLDLSGAAQSDDLGDTLNYDRAARPHRRHRAIDVVRAAGTAGRRYRERSFSPMPAWPAPKSRSANRDCWKARRPAYGSCAKIRAIARPFRNVARAAIGIGSNLGDPPAQVRAAFGALARAGRVVARSRLYRSKPWGPVPQPDFCNAVALLETALSPQALLERSKIWKPRWDACPPSGGVRAPSTWTSYSTATGASRARICKYPIRASSSVPSRCCRSARWTPRLRPRPRVSPARSANR